jgi:hypothetical protein
MAVRLNQEAVEYAQDLITDLRGDLSRNRNASSFRQQDVPFRTWQLSG